MGLFDFFKPKHRGAQFIMDSIRHNAEVIQKSEGKDRTEAEYLSICALLYDLRGRERGSEGCKLAMVIVARDYPHLLNDIVRYSEWDSGKLKLSPDDEAAMEKRHFLPSSKRSKDLASHQDDLTAQMELCANQIRDKWVDFNRTFEVTPKGLGALSGIIENFAIPVQEFVKTSYPKLYAAGGPQAFWAVVFLGVARSGVPSKEAVNRALMELDAKFSKGS